MPAYKLRQLFKGTAPMLSALLIFLQVLHCISGSQTDMGSCHDIIITEWQLTNSYYSFEMLCQSRKQTRFLAESRVYMPLYHMAQTLLDTKQLKSVMLRHVLGFQR